MRGIDDDDDEDNFASGVISTDWVVTDLMITVIV
jgi:hypothetical protein